IYNVEKKRLQPSSSDDNEPAGRNEKKRLQPLSLDNAVYAGKNELENYIASTKKPRFSNFVVENKENILNWSSEKSFFDQDQLFTLWKQRFALVFRSSEKEMMKDTLKTSKTDKEVWTTIREMVAAKEKVHDRFTIAGLNTLASMSQNVERSQADYIKSLEKQSSTQEINDNNTQEVADTTTQELDDERNDSITQEPLMMKKTQEQVFIAKPVARLATPYHVDHLSALKPTLNALFQMK
ncbi:hypothetical protein DFQ29_002011, partial [Apophysomyces sp. BC1021]